MNVINNTKIRQLDFTLLLILNGLIRHRKTVTVATELGLSQSAISHALARLRELFSDPLFIRHSHGLRPTQRALDLAPYVEHLLEEAASAIGSTETFNPMTSTREFRIGMSEYLASIIAGPLFRKFSLMAPDASFTIKSSIGAESLDELDGYQLDLLVGNFNSLPPHLSSVGIYSDKFVLAARPDHPSINQRVSRKLLESLSHVAISPGGDRKLFTDDQLSRAMIKRTIKARVARFHIAFEIVRNTDAVVIAPQLLVKQDGRLKGFNLPIKLDPINVYAIRRRQEDTGADWLVDQLSDCFQYNSFS